MRQLIENARFDKVECAVEKPTIEQADAAGIGAVELADAGYVFGKLDHCLPKSII
jgi:hypothetical protein